MSSKNLPPPAKPEVDLTHMPQYIKQAPWYLTNEQTAKEEALTHQRMRSNQQ